MADPADRAHNCLRHFGVRGRLLLAFFGISSFAVLSSAASLGRSGEE